VGYAFAAGMVASANPCGVLMLPAYALQQLRAEGGPRSAGKRALRAVQVAAAVTSGFVVIFSLTGAVIAGGGQWLISVFPYAGLLIGVAMVVLGAWLLATNKTLSLFGQTKVTAERAGGRGAGNAFLFGIAYALGSLSCTLPIFLVVVGTSLSGGGFGGAFGQFVGYALGMGTIIFAITIGAALFRRAMTRWLRAVTPYIHRMSSMFLVGAGLYLVYYWLFQAGLG
jgi:cytochrome c-type biogenesis protein